MSTGQAVLSTQGHDIPWPRWSLNLFYNIIQACPGIQAPSVHRLAIFCQALTEVEEFVSGVLDWSSFGAGRRRSSCSADKRLSLRRHVFAPLRKPRALLRPKIMWTAFQPARVWAACRFPYSWSRSWRVRSPGCQCNFGQRQAVL